MKRSYRSLHRHNADEPETPPVRQLPDAEKRAILRAITLLHSYGILTDEAKVAYEGTIRAFQTPERGVSSKKIPATALKTLDNLLKAGMMTKAEYDVFVARAAEKSKEAEADEWVTTPKLRVQLDTLLAEIRADFPAVFAGNPPFDFKFLIDRMEDYHAYAGFMKAALAPAEGRELTNTERDDLRSEIARARAVANRIGVYLNRRFAADSVALEQHGKLFEDKKKAGEARGIAEFNKGGKATPRPNRKHGARDNRGGFTLSDRQVMELRQMGHPLMRSRDNRGCLP